MAARLLIRLLVLVAASLVPRASSAVVARSETPPAPGAGDSLDDVAIWIHPEDPEKSRIIASDNETGLVIYDLSGRQLEVIPDGAFNNVDIRRGFELGDEVVDLLATSEKVARQVVLYTIDPDGRLERAGEFAIKFDGYGLCLYVSPRTGTFYVFVTSTGNQVEQWALDGSSGRIEARLARSITMTDRTEGAVADDERAVLYLAEEKIAIWRYGAEPEDGEQRVLVDSHQGGYVGKDIEGLALFRGPAGSGYLIASSQSEDSFVVYDREGDNRHRLTFRIGAGNGIDEVSQTDGIEVTSVALGSRFPFGLFIAHDDSDDVAGQNLKLVGWEEIAREADPPLMLGGFITEEQTDGGTADGGVDGGADAGTIDAGLADAGILDAGRADPLDAGVLAYEPGVDAAGTQPLAATTAPERPLGCGCSSAVPAATLAVLALFRMRRRQ